MSTILENTAEIRNALGSTMELIRDWSGRRQERRETARLRVRLIRRHGRVCGVCGTDTPGRLETAHVLALEEGGDTTEDNLILLCGDCHDRYDAGRASISEMRKARLLWLDGGASPHLAQAMEVRGKATAGQALLFRPTPEVLRPVYDLLHRRRVRGALTCARSLATDEAAAEGDRLLGRIVEANIERRRCARGSLRRAVDILSGVDPCRLDRQRVPLLHYERGFVRQMIGDHADSIADFEESGRAAAELADRYTRAEILTATLRILAVRTIRFPRRQLARAAVTRQLAEFDRLLGEVSTLDQPFAGRWSHNVLGWKWRFAFKCGDDATAARVFREYQGRREGQDATTGYTRDTGSRTCGFAAMTELRMSESPKTTARAVRLLSRSLVSLLANRVRPEGIRDYLLTLEIAISRMDGFARRSRALIQQIGSVRESILDGSSFLDPYRSVIGAR